MAQSVTLVAATPPDDPIGEIPTAPRNRASDVFERELVALIPHLRAFAHLLCGRQGIADDMAQEALAKAWRARAKFEAGTNLKAWLFTILRHAYYSHMRRAWREARWDEHLGEQIPAPPDEQMWALDLSDCVRGLSALPDRQREALLLVDAAGFSYNDAAATLGAPVGSVKSRTARGRARLAKLLDGDSELPPRSQTEPAAGFDDILAQLSAVKNVGANTHRRASPRRGRR